MKIKIFMISLIITFLSIPSVVVNAATAFVAGCNYGFLDTNTTTLVTQARQILINSGKVDILTLSTAPTRTVLQSHFNGRPHLENDILYFAGHGNKTAIDFYGCVADESGIGMGYGLAPTGHIGIRAYNISRVNMAVLQGCETAKDTTGNITQLFVTLGAKASLGWTDKINTASGEPWAERFWIKIAAGNTMLSAITHANSYTYLFNNIKKTRTYGNTSTKLNTLQQTMSLFPNPINSIDSTNKEINNIRNKYKFNTVVNNKNVIEKVYDSINQITRKFNKEDYILEVTTNDDMTIYDLILNIKGVSVELGYTVFVKEDVIINAFDNTQNRNIESIKQNIANIDINTINMDLVESEMLVYNYMDHKLYKYSEILDIAPNGEKRYDVQIAEILTN